MRLRYSDEDEAFRAELLAWLDEHPPPTPEELDRPQRSSADMPDWARALAADALRRAAGWCPGFPPELGGRNATPSSR